MYFIACAHHLAWGYVDQPPLIALVAGASLHLFGDSITAIRIFPGLAQAALVALCGWWAVRLGGGLFAAALAMLAVALAPFDFAVGNLLTMNAFEPLFWTLAAILAVERIEAPRRWQPAALGVVLGSGFLNKWSMLAFALALAAGILLSPARRVVVNAGTALTVLIAAVIAAPNVAWQAAHGWPQIELLRNAAALKDATTGPLAFVLQQGLVMGPGAVPLWVAGLIRLGTDRRLRGLAWSYGLLLILYIAVAAKIYYMAPIYPMLIAAGAPLLERVLARTHWRLSFAAVVALTSLAILPAATPILPLADYLTYQRALDLRPVRMERRETGLVPQHFADQLGWWTLLETVRGVVAGLDRSDRHGAAILTSDYGQAAALQFLGHDDGLPLVISGHNQYYLWGPHGDHRVLIAIGIPRATLERAYRDVRRAAIYDDPYVLPYSNHLPVYVCRDPRLPLTAFWPQFRHYI